MRRLTFSEAKQVSIIEYLSTLGFEPAKIRGVEHWYHAPDRPDHDPSFKVDAEQNVWYDHGEGEGGTIIELGMRLHKCSPVEFLAKLSEENYRSDLILIQRSFPPKKRDNLVEIQLVKPLTNDDLLFYIHQRGIDNQLVKKYCHEVEFTIRERVYHAIGFPNRAGGWELRNAWFKGSSSPKDVTIIQGDHFNKLIISEGFIDYLSLLKIEDSKIKSVLEGSDFMILNSLSFLNKNHEFIRSYPERNLFLDNDAAAVKAKAALSANEISFQDRSDLYKGHKDVNELLVHRMKQSTQLIHKKPKGPSL